MTLIADDGGRPLTIRAKPREEGEYMLVGMTQINMRGAKKNEEIKWKLSLVFLRVGLARLPLF